MSDDVRAAVERLLQEPFNAEAYDWWFASREDVLAVARFALTAAAQLASSRAENERLRAALEGLAMRQFRADGTFCWCDGPVLVPEEWHHEPDCTRARAALSATTAAGTEAAE